MNSTSQHLAQEQRGIAGSLLAVVTGSLQGILQVSEPKSIPMTKFLRYMYPARPRRACNNFQGVPLSEHHES